MGISRMSPAVVTVAHVAVRAAVTAAAVAQNGAHAAHAAVLNAYLAVGQRAVALGSLPPGTQNDFNTIQNWMLGVGAVVGVGSLIAVGVMMMGDHGHGKGAHHGSKLVKVFAGMALVGSASAIGSATPSLTMTPREVVQGPSGPDDSAGRDGSSARPPSGCWWCSCWCGWWSRRPARTRQAPPRRRGGRPRRPPR